MQGACEGVLLGSTPVGGREGSGPEQRKSRAMRPQPTLWMALMLGCYFRVAQSLGEPLHCPRSYWTQAAPGRGVTSSLQQKQFLEGTDRWWLPANGTLTGGINPSVLKGDLGVHRSSHHSMLCSLRPILIGILQTRCYHPVSQMRKLNFGEYINWPQATKVVTTSLLKPNSLKFLHPYFPTISHSLESFTLPQILPAHTEIL